MNTCHYLTWLELDGENSQDVHRVQSIHKHLKCLKTHFAYIWQWNELTKNTAWVHDNENRVNHPYIILQQAFIISSLSHPPTTKSTQQLCSQLNSFFREVYRYFNNLYCRDCTFTVQFYVNPLPCRILHAQTQTLLFFITIIDHTAP